MPYPFLFGVLALAATVAWLVLELRQRNSLRIVLGLLSAALLSLTSWFTASLVAEFRALVYPMAELAHLRASLDDLLPVLNAGDIEAAKQSLTTYQATLQSTGDTYEASMALWQSMPAASAVRP